MLRLDDVAGVMNAPLAADKHPVESRCELLSSDYLRAHRCGTFPPADAQRLAIQDTISPLQHQPDEQEMIKV